MTTVLRPVGYTGSLQRLVWPDYWGSQATAYLWGAGGGGGGGDVATGGNGTGGGFASISFPVAAGDIIEVAVGGPGGGGPGGRRSGQGGFAGSSLVGDVVWTTLNALGPGFTRTSNQAWCAWLNSWAIWNSNIYTSTYDNTFTVNFPATGGYTVTMSADNYGEVYIDGVQVVAASGFNTTWSQTVTVSVGTHSVRVRAINTGGPGGVGVTIAGGVNSYSGGTGGYSGPSGYSGGGGGSGGATVLRVNGAVLAVAGGGGGGGGAGLRGGNGNAPGGNGQSGSDSAGQNGGNQPGDGGGGGAGGGGFRGGNGGYWGGGPGGYGDLTGQGGSYGVSSGWSIENPTGVTPGGVNNIYYTGGGRGGAGSTGNGAQGQAGSAVFAFEVSGVQVVNANDWRPVKTLWVKNSGIWQAAKAVWVKNGGVWRPTLGSLPLDFSNVSGNFGVVSRNGPAYTPPEPMGEMGAMGIF